MTSAEWKELDAREAMDHADYIMVLCRWAGGKVVGPMYWVLMREPTDDQR